MKTKILKKTFCFILFCLLSINSFAATVSDNDGSAFLTKGEFDSAKIQFLDRINQYQTNIDSLIDTAIASYLAGIQLGKKSENALPLRSLKTITCLGYNSIEDFKYPEFTVDYVILAEAQYDLTIPDHDRPSDSNRWGIEN